MLIIHHRFGPNCLRQSLRADSWALRHLVLRCIVEAIQDYVSSESSLRKVHSLVASLNRLREVHHVFFVASVACHFQDVLLRHEVFVGLCEVGATQLVVSSCMSLY